MYNILAIALIIMIIVMGLALLAGWILLRFRNKRTFYALELKNII